MCIKHCNSFSSASPPRLLPILDDEGTVCLGKSRFTEARNREAKFLLLLFIVLTRGLGFSAGGRGPVLGLPPVCKRLPLKTTTSPSVTVPGLLLELSFAPEGEAVREKNNFMGPTLS